VSAVASRGRFQQLDALRAVAIAVVMLHHYINPPILLSGFGVTFLFVLSGYFAPTRFSSFACACPRADGHGGP